MFEKDDGTVFSLQIRQALRDMSEAIRHVII